MSKSVSLVKSADAAAAVDQTDLFADTVTDTSDAATDAAEVTTAPAMVPLASLTGSDLTKAIRSWAVENGIPVGDRGAIAPEVTAQAVIANPDVPAPVVKAARQAAAAKVPNVYDIHAVDGAVYTVEGGRGKATVERLAERAGIAVAEVDHIVRGGVVVDVPNRASGPVVEPWRVLLVDGTETEYRGNSRGRMSVARVAEALDIAPLSIVSVTRGDKVYRVAHIVSFESN